MPPPTADQGKPGKAQHHQQRSHWLEVLSFGLDVERLGKRPDLGSAGLADFHSAGRLERRIVGQAPTTARLRISTPTWTASLPMSTRGCGTRCSQSFLATKPSRHLPRLVGAAWTHRHARKLGAARSFSMQLYRDHENGQLAKYAEIIASDKRAHWLWRKALKRPVPDLRTPAIAADFLDRWTALRVSTHERPHMPDPRKRSIAYAMSALDLEDADREQRLSDAAD